MTTATAEAPATAQSETEATPGLSAVILAENLLRALNAVKPAIAKRTTPICETVRIDSHQGRLRFTATNRDIAIESWAGAKIKAEGGACVPFRELYTWAKSLPPVTVAIDVGSFSVGPKLPGPPQREKATATFEAARGTVRIADCWPVADFPRLPEVLAVAPAITMTGKAWREAAAYVGLAVSTYTDRPVLQCVHMTASRQGDHLEMEGAYGFRLHQATVPIDNRSDGFDLLVTATAIAATVKLIPAKPPRYGYEDIAIRVGEEGICFDIGDGVVYAKPLQGTFPYTASIVAGTRTADYHLATINPVDLLAVAKRLAPIAGNNSGIVRLRGIPDQKMDRLECSTTIDGATAMLDEIDAPGVGDRKVALNCRYLIDALTPPSKTATVSIATPSHAISIDAPGRTAIIMPMPVRW